MKANKALKRIAKIEDLTLEVMQRLSKATPHVAELLKDLKAAVARVKKSVSAPGASRTAKKKAAPARKKAAPRKTAVKAPKAKAPKKVARVSQAAKKPAAKRRVPAPVHPAEVTVQEPTSSMDATKSELQ